jgi:hypothetical protein
MHQKGEKSTRMREWQVILKIKKCRMTSNMGQTEYYIEQTKKCH